MIKRKKLKGLKELMVQDLNKSLPIKVKDKRLIQEDYSPSTHQRFLAPFFEAIGVGHCQRQAMETRQTMSLNHFVKSYLYYLIMILITNVCYLYKNEKD